MCTFNVDEEFEDILGEIDEETYLNDPEEAAPCAVQSPTIERQVLVSLAVTK